MRRGIGKFNLMNGDQKHTTNGATMAAFKLGIFFFEVCKEDEATKRRCKTIVEALLAQALCWSYGW
eukprot:scaffold29822_cov20-Prasinocladus_malaysianus.AAC.1